MPIIASAGESKSFAPAPAGTHQAVCVDVIDKGMQDDKYNPGVRKHKVVLSWQIAELRDDGKPFLVSRWYTLSLHEKATLRKDLESWRGKLFTADELRAFDLERLIGANCLLGVQQYDAADGETKAKVTSVMALPKGMGHMAVSKDYVRVKDRPTEGQSQSPAEEDSVPF